MKKHHFMKYCSTCGSKIEIESFFCSKCGNKLGELALPENENILKDAKAISDELNNVEIDTKSQIQLFVKSLLVLLIGSILITIPFFFLPEPEVENSYSNSTESTVTDSSVNPIEQQSNNIEDSKIDSEYTTPMENSSESTVNNDYVLQRLNEYTKIISSGEFEQLNSIFSDHILRFHSVNNITVNDISNEAKNYLKKWTIVSETFESIEKVSENEYNYSKTYTITRNKDNKEFNYKIRGYVKFDTNGKIVELVDSSTEKIKKY